MKTLYTTIRDNLKDETIYISQRDKENNLTIRHYNTFNDVFKDYKGTEKVKHYIHNEFVNGLYVVLKEVK